MSESQIPRLNPHRGTARMELVSFSSRPGQNQVPNTPIAQPQPTRATPGSALRSLRNLLPFGPGKGGNSSQNLAAERKNSLSVDRKSSFTAERKQSTDFGRKTSFSSDKKQFQTSSLGRRSEDVVPFEKLQLSSERPSFSEPFDLSTIIEADISKNIIKVEPDSPSFLYSPTDIDSEVRRALAPPSPTPSPLKPRADESLHSADIDSMDPDLRTLLSPHKRKDIPRFESPPPAAANQPALRRSEAKGRILRPLPSMNPSAQSSPARKPQDREKKETSRRASTSRMPTSVERPSPSRVVTEALPRRSLDYNSPTNRLSYSSTRPSAVRSRKRSESVSGDTYAPKTPAPQLPSRPSSALGPRTARAFRAAGIISDESPTDHDRDTERDSQQPRPSSRPVRSVSALGITHGIGMPHSSSWGRSASRTGMSADSPTFSVPASHAPSYSQSYSPSPPSASTAPTSISTTFTPTAVDSQGSGNVAVDVLLRALADAQASTQALRQENETLKRRVEDLERTLTARDRELQLQHRRYTPSPSRDYTSTSMLRDDTTLNSRARVRDSGEDRVTERPRLDLRLDASPLVLPSDLHPRSRFSSSPALSAEDTTHRRRYTPSPISATREQERGVNRDFTSAHIPRSSLQLSIPITTRPPSTASMASSLFPNVPRDMSMLMNEDVEPASSSGSHSPKKQDGRIRSIQSSDLGPTPYPSPIKQPHPRRAHAHSKSIESATDFSFVESSPRSLFLRPEHDLLLRPSPEDEDDERSFGSR